jgi:hypothetical protein
MRYAHPSLLILLNKFYLELEILPSDATSSMYVAMRLPRQFRTSQYESTIPVHVEEPTRYDRLLGRIPVGDVEQPATIHKQRCAIDIFALGKASTLRREYHQPHQAVGSGAIRQLVNSSPVANSASASFARPQAPSSPVGENRDYLQ